MMLPVRKHSLRFCADIVLPCCRWSEEADKLVEQGAASSAALPLAEQAPSSRSWRVTLRDMFADRRILKAAAVVRLRVALCQLQLQL